MTQEMTVDLRADREVALSSTHDSYAIHPLIQATMNGQLDTEKMRELLEIQKEYEANEARKAFHAALAQFKLDIPLVRKDKVNTQFNSKYASKAALVNTVGPALGVCGLSATWEIDQDEHGTVIVTCVLSHRMGHSNRVTMRAKPDSSGAKNPIQQLKSTKTYLEISTFEAVTGVVASDDGDDDGNGFSSFESGTAEQRSHARNNANAKKELQPYPKEKFDKNFDSWEKSILEGGKTAETIIKTIQSRFTLSEEQKLAIRTVEA